jgi:hypothetical protein
MMTHRYASVDRREKAIPLVCGYLNVFPNNKHQNRVDGFGCSSLSPMKLGPVIHREPGLPNALTIEGYHQYSKVYPNEIDINNNPTEEFRKRRLEGYINPIPPRHKFDSKQMTKLRKEIKGQNRNEPSYTVHYTLDGKEKRFTYVESRYFYCKAYEKLAKETDASLRERRPKGEDFKKLVDIINKGTNIIICGYDAYEVTKDLYIHYCDATKAFGHELVLYSILMIDYPINYPWNL